MVTYSIKDFTEAIERQQALADDVAALRNRIRRVSNENILSSTIRSASLAYGEDLDAIYEALRRSIQDLLLRKYDRERDEERTTRTRAAAQSVREMSDAIQEATNDGLR